MFHDALLISHQLALCQHPVALLLYENVPQNDWVDTGATPGATPAGTSITIIPVNTDMF